MRQQLSYAFIFVCAAIISTSVAQTDQPIQASEVVVEANVSAVTLYRGRAAVTRTATIELQPGLYDVKFQNLPESVQPQTIQARARGGSSALKVIGVDYSVEALAEAASSQIAAIDARIKELRRGITRIEEQLKILASQGKLIDDITARMAADASKQVGSELNLDSLTAQIAFLAKQRAELMNQRLELDEQKAVLQAQLQVAEQERQAIAGAGNTSRTAVVSLVATEATGITVELTYLVANATWEPEYNIRAVLDGSSAQIEYNAMLIQRTGENWDNVKLTLSTAQPTMAANPPTLTPWFVDVFRPMPAAPPAPSSAVRRSMDDRDAGGASEPMHFGVELKALNGFAADAEIGGDGPAVSFELPRPVTVKTNIQKQQRTRIATINTSPKFAHVAVPSLTEAVYIRGDLVNTSAYQLLPGRASIFVAQDYVGPTTLGAVPPNGEFKLHFGIDPAVKATRQMITKKTENTGLLSGGRRTAYDYRLSIDNGSGKAISVELWDRYPVSRSSEIQVETVDLSHPLSTDPKYIAEERPQGMMKWVLPVAANAAGKNALTVSYGVRINRAKDIEMTPLPE